MKVPPFLSHLRTDRRGIPVPVVNRWGKDEATAKVVVQFDRWVKTNAVFIMDADQPEPDFTAQSPQRQRECVIRGRCQVCGRGIPWSRRFLVLSGVSTKVIPSAGPLQHEVVVTEPWLDERCARFAIEKCPALIRRKDSEDLVLHPITASNQVQVVLSVGSVSGPLEAETTANPVGIWSTLHVLNVDIVRRPA